MADEIQRSGTSGAQISVLKLDMDSLKSVRECATAFLDERKQLNILINNAGASQLLLFVACYGRDSWVLWEEG